ncbi:MAG: hypothetical protein JST48_06795 [Bacteroidetes bacterium]|nr:hypothetical protein [Bacteroidota bacterium]
MVKRIVILFVVWVAASRAEAQFNQNTRGNSQSQSSSRFYFGGGGNLGGGTDTYGNRYFYFSLLPVIMYQVDNRVSVGATITYSQYSYPNLNTSFKQYGLGPFVRYTINPLFLQAEYDVINAPTYGGINNNEIVRSNYSRFLLGVGYLMPMGNRSMVNAMLMYDVLYKAPSVFNTPIVYRVIFLF